MVGQCVEVAYFLSLIHISEPTRLLSISYAVFCLKNKTVTLATAIKLYIDAKEIFPKTNSDYDRALMNEGSARGRLAEMGVDSTVNLETAINLYVDAKEIFPKTSASYA